MTRLDTDILVAGGGVAGLAATSVFASAGFRTICVDPVPPVTDAAQAGSDLRSTAFLLPSVRLLEQSGLWSSLAPYAEALRIMRIADAGGEEEIVREYADFDATELDEEVFGYNLPNWLLRREMTAFAQNHTNAELLTSRSVAHITPRTNEAVVRLSDGTQVRAKLVVAADGRNSSVRDILGIGAKRWNYGQKAIVFSVSHPIPHENVSTEVHRTGGPFTLVPLPDQDTDMHFSAVVWMDTGPNIKNLATLDEAEFEDRLNRRSCGVLGKLTVTGEKRVWPIISQVADRLDGPRTALIAEAAHVIPPIGAQGLNMSLSDIDVLLGLIKPAQNEQRDFGSEKILRRYHRARHPDILTRIAGVDVLNRSAMLNPAVLRDIRLAGLRALHGIEPLRHRIMRAGLGLGSASPGATDQ